MVRAVYSQTTLNAIQYYIIIVREKNNSVLFVMVASSFQNGGISIFLIANI